jgi:hypothetical protein
LRVHFEPNHKEYLRTFRWLRHDGAIPRDGVNLIDKRASGDIVVLTHERRWSTHPGLHDELRGWKVLAEKRVHNIPLWTVFRQP